jgi:hypothetical protein
MTPGRWAGPRWASPGRGEEKSWARNGPVWFRNLFFLLNLFYFCIFKTFCNLSYGLKYLEIQKFIKLLKLTRDLLYI